MNKFKKILIANRGEIAVRIIRACRELDIQAIALYAPEDQDGFWIGLADEAHEIKKLHGSKAYLNIEAILEIAKRSKADAIHPGYGFLSEDARFAQACAENGIHFIGPTPSAMRTMGNKTEARKLAKSLGIPLLPGTDTLPNLQAAEKEAAILGYPLLFKAAAGGGGRGMRLVQQQSDLRNTFESASREALASFGDGSLYLEKVVAHPRHIEIQILADQHGNRIHLGERECSIQRKYQKLIEESPSPAVDETLRNKLGDCALRMAETTGYTNAGTVEFLLDENKQFYFLEINARLQVEHPVTEWVTGIDLVKAQIRIAQGEKLPWRQDEIHLNGWAIEARVNAENPELDFLPSTGKVKRLMIPGGPGVRVDTALYSDYSIPDEFDSLIAKVIAFGDSRDEALSRLKRALFDFRIGGIATSIPFILQILKSQKFNDGNLSTRFLEEEKQMLAPILTEGEMKLAAILAAVESQKSSIQFSEPMRDNLWSRAGRLENVAAFP